MALMSSEQSKPGKSSDDPLSQIATKLGVKPLEFARLLWLQTNPLDWNHWWLKIVLARTIKNKMDSLFGIH